MPINIPDDLPAFSTLESENIFLMTESRAERQDIRPLKLAILNLMPTKVETEIQLMRILSNTPLQIDVTLVVPSSHESKNTSVQYLDRFYRKFSEIEGMNFDGFIITGAPLEDLEYEEIDYWDEMCRIMDWADEHVTTTVYICWAALAGLYHKYGIQKRDMGRKKNGIFEYLNLSDGEPLMRGIDQVLRIPQSRYATVSYDDIQKNPRLHIVALGEDHDPGIIVSESGDVYITGHLEYDADTIAREYQRDLDKGMTPVFPVNYYPNDDARFDPQLTWRSYATLIFTNWLNYYVYQNTPYDISRVKKSD